MTNPSIRKILLLSANPKNTDQLRLDEEFREIKERLRLGTQRERFVVFQGEAIRAKDLLQQLLDFKPNIIHFSGHASSNGIFLEDEMGQLQLVNGNALTNLFSLLDNIECVLLNACYSESQATLIHRHVPCVIGMKMAIGDMAALKFATGFYTALAAGQTILKSYKFGCAAIELAGINEQYTPVIHTQNNKPAPKVQIEEQPQMPRSLDAIKANNQQIKHYDIFISYRTTNREWVEVLARNLKQQGYRVFLDTWEIQGGQNFTQTIYDAIKSSHAALMIATPDAAESGWVQREYELMVQQQTENQDFFYIPVIFGEFPDFPFLETVHAVDFKDSNQTIYNEAFQRLICALKGDAPGSYPSYKGEIEYPKIYQDEHRPLAQKEQSFIDDTFHYLDTGIPVMILGQADTGTQHYANALKAKAQIIYGAENTLHIYPPNSVHANTSAYFGRLVKQCCLEKYIDSSIIESWQWADALAERLEQVEEIFLLISGFENGEETARTELAGELRGLAERFPNELKLVIIGGEKLAALKYQYGSMSLLNQVQEQRLPDLSETELQEIFGQRYPELQQKELTELLEFTGHNPRLVHACLQAGRKTAIKCESFLINTPLPSQLFAHFQKNKYKKQLCNYLQSTEVGMYSAWPQNELIRQLYWNNLIKQYKDKFIWRCEYIRQIGKQNLSCDELE